jgi:hypothetical protein
MTGHQRIRRLIAPIAVLTAGSVALGQAVRNPTHYTDEFNDNMIAPVLVDTDIDGFIVDEDGNTIVPPVDFNNGVVNLPLWIEQFSSNTQAVGTLAPAPVEPRFIFREAVSSFTGDPDFVSDTRLRRRFLILDVEERNQRLEFRSLFNARFFAYAGYETFWQFSPTFEDTPPPWTTISPGVLEDRFGQAVIVRIPEEDDEFGIIGAPDSFSFKVDAFFRFAQLRFQRNLNPAIRQSIVLTEGTLSARQDTPGYDDLGEDRISDGVEIFIEATTGSSLTVGIRGFQSPNGLVWEQTRQLEPQTGFAGSIEVDYTNTADNPNTLIVAFIQDAERPDFIRLQQNGAFRVPVDARQDPDPPEGQESDLPAFIFDPVSVNVNLGVFSDVPRRRVVPGAIWFDNFEVQSGFVFEDAFDRQIPVDPLDPNGDGQTTPGDLVFALIDPRLGRADLEVLIDVLGAPKADFFFRQVQYNKAIGRYYFREALIDYQNITNSRRFKRDRRLDISILRSLYFF